MTTQLYQGKSPDELERDFVDAIGELNADERRFLLRMYVWADSLRKEGLVRFETLFGTQTKGLKLWLLDEKRSMAWFFIKDRQGNGHCDARLELHVTVLNRRAPKSLRLIAKLLGVEAANRSMISIPSPTEDLLRAVADAYREAADKRGTSRRSPEELERDFVDAIEEADVAERPFLRRMYTWADSLRNEGLTTLEVRFGTQGQSGRNSKRLRLSLPDGPDIGECLAYIDHSHRKAGLSLHESVIMRHAPNSLWLLANMPGVNVANGSWNRRPSEELLLAVADAYREAAGFPPQRRLASSPTAATAGPGQRHFGPIPGIEVGSVFESRRDLAAAGVHQQTEPRISGWVTDGADSVLLNGGYEDDLDDGDLVVYTGADGKDRDSRRQTTNQELNGRNLALAKSCNEAIPVRVVRGWRDPSGFGPEHGFRYDGIYYVERYWSEIGRSGHRIWRFRLVRDDPSPFPWNLMPVGEGQPAPRRSSIVERMIRDSDAARRVKELHDHRCQICGIRLETTAGAYAEGAHIRPLGRPHDGPDELANLLCLCPNHHVLFDNGAILISDDLSIVTLVGQDLAGPDKRLRTAHGHHVKGAHLAYHREHFGWG